MPFRFKNHPLHVRLVTGHFLDIRFVAGYKLALRTVSVRATPLRTGMALCMTFRTVLQSITRGLYNSLTAYMIVFLHETPMNSHGVI